MTDREIKELRRLAESGGNLGKIAHAWIRIGEQEGWVRAQ